MRKKVWINKDDFVLVSLRDYQDDRCDIILKYSPEEVKMLKSYDEIPKNISSSSGKVEIDETDDIQFNDIEIDIENI
jgi:translation initiation factor 1A